MSEANAGAGADSPTARLREAQKRGGSPKEIEKTSTQIIKKIAI
jgi:hypothetical protein